MSKKNVDIGTQTTVEKILKAVPGKFDYNPFVSINRAEVDDRLFRVGKIPNCSTSISPIVLFYNDSVYIIPHNTTSVYIMTNDFECWKETISLPFEIDSYNTRVLVFFNPDTRRNELHILGGSGKLSRTHFKYDLDRDGGLTIASELPYEFCAGKAVVYNNEIHIFGGGNADFSTSTSIPSGFLNNHYKWNGLVWEKASNLQISCYGASPFVLDNELYLIGGKTTSSTSNIPLYKMSSNNTWSSAGTVSLSNIPFHSSVVSNEGSFTIIGGVTTSFKTKIIKSLSTQGAVMFTVDTANIDGISTENCYSGQSAAIDKISDTVYSASNGMLYISTGNIGYSYKTVIHSENLTGTNWDLLNINNSLVMATLNKGDKKIVNLDSGDIMDIQFNMAKHGIVEIDNGDIYLFNISTDGKLVAVYVKTINSDGTVTYHPNTFTLPISVENPYVCWYDGRIHVLGNTKTGYNHYTLVNFKSEFKKEGNISVTLPSSSDTSTKRSMCVHNGKMYYAYIYEATNTKEIRVYQFDGYRWSLVSKDSLTSTYKFEIEMVSFQSKLFLLVFNYRDLDYMTSFYLKVLVGNKFVTMSECTLDTKNTSANAVVYNNYIHIAGTDYDDNKKINRYALQYAFSISEGMDAYEILLDKERVFICDKTKFVPIIGYVEEVNNGFRSLETGKYTFIRISDD